MGLIKAVENHYALHRRAIRAHPHNKHNQRQWLRAVMYMRNRPGDSIWLLDNEVIKAPS